VIRPVLALPSAALLAQLLRQHDQGLELPEAGEGLQLVAYLQRLLELVDRPDQLLGPELDAGRVSPGPIRVPPHLQNLRAQLLADAVAMRPAGEARHGSLDLGAKALDLLEDGRLDRHGLLLERRKLSY
jgi:hypothetical protein